MSTPSSTPPLTPPPSNKRKSNSTPGSSNTEPSGSPDENGKPPYKKTVIAGEQTPVPYSPTMEPGNTVLAVKDNNAGGFIGETLYNEHGEEAIGSYVNAIEHQNENYYDNANKDESAYIYNYKGEIKGPGPGLPKTNLAKGEFHLIGGKRRSKRRRSKRRRSKKSRSKRRRRTR
jgi:hypothetical protein